MPSAHDLSTTTASFPMIRDRDWLYVDKTAQIHALLQSASTHVFLARPRRFGKSLLISTLEALFQGQETLFRSTAIHPLWDWNVTFPVIRLDMSLRDIPKSDTLRNWLSNRMTDYLFPAYGIDLPRGERSASELFEFLLRRVAHDFGPPVVLIDEYDTPITSCLEDRDTVRDILTILRQFYGVLKSCDDVLHFAFMTGIGRFTRTGLFSGANNFDDISFKLSACTLCGITDSELQTSPLQSYLRLAAQAAHLQPDILHASLADWYNGYRFATQGQRVYNPFSLFHCLRDLAAKELVHQAPTQSLPDYWMQSGPPRFLFDLIARHPSNLDSALRVSAHTAAHNLLDAETLSEPNPEDLATFLLQTGYQTLSDPEQELTFPNNEVAHAFHEGLLLHLGRRIRQADAPLASGLGETLLQGDAQGFVRYFNQFLGRIPYTSRQRPFLRVDAHAQPDALHAKLEAYYHLVLHVALEVAGLAPLSEGSTHTGKLDLAVQHDRQAIIVECKVNQSAQAALAQIRHKGYFMFFADGSTYVRGLGLNIDTHRYLCDQAQVHDYGVLDGSVSLA